MKTRKTIIAASIAALFLVPLTVSAKAKWEYHENQWNEVVSYGNVSLAEDSAQQWGPWSEFVQPAAGGPSVVFLPQVAELYRPLPGVTPTPVPTPTDVCGAGAWCGYAAYMNDSYNYGNGYGNGYGDGYGGGYYSNTGHHPGYIALNLSGPASGEGTASYRITGFPLELAPLQGESGGLTSSFYGPIGSFYASNSAGTWIDGGEGHPEYYNAAYVTHGDFAKYISGDGGESATYGSYIAGIVTSAADIAALLAGRVQATYSGFTVYPHSGHNHFPTSPVVINVDFGNATWKGTWNSGVDGYTHTHGADSAGVVHVYGQVGFTAQGTISGANIQSTSVGTLDKGATVTGQVKGSFFGPQAAAVGGVSDITKTNPSAEYSKARNVDLFIANKVVDKPR